MNNTTYAETLKLLGFYKDKYQALYDDYENKDCAAAKDYLNSVKAFEIVIADMNRESNWQDDQEAHASVMLDDELGKEMSLADWARREGISPATARQKAARGVLKTARRVGRDWVISSYELNKDNRKRG